MAARPERLRNVAQLVARSARTRPDALALRHGDRRITWAELDTAVTAFAAGLLRSGRRPGERVALSLGNGPAFVVSYFGILRAGLVAVPLNTGCTSAELDVLLDTARPALVLAEAATVDAVRAGLADRAPVAVVGQASYDRIGAAGSRADAPAPPDPADCDPESLAVLLFTAGTSGPSKGAMLSHRALLADVDQLCALTPAPLAPDDVLLVVLPLFHVYALGAGLGLAAAVGAGVVLADRFEPAATLELIRAYGVTTVLGAPPMYVAWSREPDLADRLQGVRTLVSGAAPLAPGVAALFAERLGRPVWTGYGMTEASPVVATTLGTGRATPGSVGHPLPGIEVRLIDEDGGPVDDGDPGELEIRGPNLFSGYWPDGSGGPRPDGWWPTGDVAYADEHGDLHLVDRRRDVVLVSGFNVYPFEVETVLAAHPGVAEAAVVGVPDERTGSAVKAYVVPLPGHEIDVSVLREHAAAHLARFKTPREIAVVPALPHSASGKVVRSRLREPSTDGSRT